ncbi:acyl-CoA dehydrogenase family protein [Novosphingobium colocasiae]
MVFTTSAVEDGDIWVLNGEKWFASNARFAAFYIFMAVTDPEAPPHKRMSLFFWYRRTPLASRSSATTAFMARPKSRMAISA